MLLLNFAKLNLLWKTRNNYNETNSATNNNAPNHFPSKSRDTNRSSSSNAKERITTKEPKTTTAYMRPLNRTFFPLRAFSCRSFLVDPKLRPAEQISWKSKSTSKANGKNRVCASTEERLPPAPHNYHRTRSRSENNREIFIALRSPARYQFSIGAIVCFENFIGAPGSFRASAFCCVFSLGSFALFPAWALSCIRVRFFSARQINQQL